MLKTPNRTKFEVSLDDLGGLNFGGLDPRGFFGSVSKPEWTRSVFCGRWFRRRQRCAIVS